MTWTFSFGGEMIYTITPPLVDGYFREIATIAIEEWLNELRYPARVSGQ